MAYWPTRLAIVMIWLLSLLPLPILRQAGRGLGYLMFRLFGSRRKIAQTNVSLCFPELDTHQHRNITQQHFQELGASILTTGINWWASEKRLQSMFHIEGLEHIHNAVSQGQNVVLLAPHFISLEIGGIYLSRLFPTISMYQFAKNKVMDQTIRRGRSRFGIELVERKEPMRSLVRKIRQGKLFYYLPDQDPGPVKGIFVPFFGVNAATFPMLGRFAKMGKAVVIPCVTRQRNNGSGYTMQVHSPIPDYPSGDDYADTLRMNQVIEALVRSHPEQYFWVHKRFKTRPEGEAGIY